VWTQIKVNNVFHGQLRCEVPKTTPQPNGEEKTGAVRKTLQIRRNAKIFNHILLERWLSFYEKNKQVEEKLTQSFAKRNRAYKTCDLKSINLA
jgi:hypothetical protein